jgi:photosystem II stability/assembly factor-like uncharacterized protein
MLLVGIIPLFVSQSRADAVIDWNATAITVMLRVPALARSATNDMAYVHVAIYDAVNAIDGRYSAFAVAPSNGAPWASKEAAVAAAAYRVLVRFYASGPDTTQRRYLDSVYAAALALLPNDSTKTRGIAIGDTVATRFLALRAGDGRDAIVTYVWQSPGPGVYQPTPPGAAQYQPVNPWLPQLRPFSFGSSSQFRAPGPASLTSDVYTRDFNEVKRYGSRDSALTTAQQREIARFHTENPGVQLARNIRLFATSRAMSLADNARLFAQLYVTIGDATIAGWDSKYYYNYWRPSTAIRAADSDGNPLTERDTSWLPLVNTPPHPEYPAAHGLAMGGLAYGLEKFFGTTNVPLTLTSNVTGTQHSFNNINELITETINARVYGGMHFRSSVEDGITIGRDVAAWVARRYFLRLNASPWVAQRSGLSAGTPTNDMEFVAVSNSVCWGVKTADNTTSNLYIRTTDGGAHWTASTITQAPASWRGSNIMAIDSNTAWIAMHDPSAVTSGGVFKTTNGGTNWTRQTTAFPSSGGYANFIHFFDSDNGACVGNPNGGYWEIYTTTNGGNLWTRVNSSNIPPPAGGEFTFFDYASAGKSLWFGTDNAALYRSTNRGATWTVNRNIGGVGFVPAFKDTAIGRFSRFVPGNQVLATTDGGNTLTGTGVSAPVGCSSFFIRYVPGTTASYVITSPSGVFGSTPGSAFTVDGGVTWTLIDNSVSRGPSAFASAHAGWCGGPTDSIYKWTGNLLATSVKQTKTIAVGFRLEQNYPNPFNPSTKIGFRVPGSGLVSLKVFDVLGREVRTLVNEKLETGSYETTFDARGLASGVYYYRIQAGNFVETKKLLLLR